MSRFHISEALWKQIHNFSTFPQVRLANLFAWLIDPVLMDLLLQTGVSLQQMVQFGANPSPGTLYRAGQFLAEELPVRLAHRVRELDTLPNKLNEMPSIEKGWSSASLNAINMLTEIVSFTVKAWYAQSFEELVSFPWPKLPPEVSKVLQSNDANAPPLPHTRRNPSLPPHLGGSGTSKWGDASKRRAPIRYYANPRTPSDFQYPGELLTVNEKFADLLSQIKTRHDPVVTSIAQGILEYKKMRGPDAAVDTETRYFLDRFYMSRIGIRVLIGQHIALCSAEPNPDYVGVIVRIPSLVPRESLPTEMFFFAQCTKTNLHDVASQAIDNATFVCEDFYNVFKAPTVHLKCPEDLTFMYIPSHLVGFVFHA